MLVTDYSEIYNLHEWHHVAASKRDATQMAMSQTSIDMSMVATDFNFSVDLFDLVKAGDIDHDRIALSCGRALQLKKNLGLLSAPMPTTDGAQIASVGSNADWSVALDLARESITLLKNQADLLPLSPDAPNRIFVTGPSSDSLRLLCGGWTMQWQGAPSDDELYGGQTIRSALHGLIPDTNVLAYYDGCTIDECNEEQRAQTVQAAAGANVIVVCLSEPVYAEKPGNIFDVSLDSHQLQLVRDLHQTGIPVVLVLTVGRPRLLRDVADLAAGIVHAYLPGPKGGQAIAEVPGLPMLTPGVKV